MSTIDSRDEQSVLSPETIEWASMRQEQSRKLKAGEWPNVLSARELMARPSPPDWFLRDHEYQYRKGFYHGIIEASYLVSDLYKKGGYVRPSEIANILYQHGCSLRKWKSTALREEPLKEYGHPNLKWSKWNEVKKEVHARDGWACVNCGAREKLEAHHQTPVCEGGLPDINNLITLCLDCHRGAK